MLRFLEKFSPDARRKYWCDRLNEVRRELTESAQLNAGLCPKCKTLRKVDGRWTSRDSEITLYRCEACWADQRPQTKDLTVRQAHG